MRIAICDDDTYVVEDIGHLLMKNGKEEKIFLDVDTFSDGEDLWEEIQKNGGYDIIYLDIEMKQMDGITLAKNIRQKDPYTVLIFVSGYDHYWRQLFDVEPFRFLCKPVDEKVFRTYFSLARDRITAVNERFVFQIEKKIYQVPYKEIIYMESKRRTIQIRTTGETYTYYAKLNDVEQQIRAVNKYFIRLQRSFLVNFLFIRSMNMKEAELITGETITLSPKCKDEAMERYAGLLKM